MDDIEVEYTQGTRNLVVYIDQKLNWSKHFDNITKLPKQYLMQLIGALSKRWGPKARLVRWIYTAVVRPHVTYTAAAN